MYNVLNYIHENIRQRLTVEETAAHFGYSKWHFCTKFHQYTGMTFVEYTRHYRIQLAAMDILRGMKISEVAFAYGYDTIGGFNKAFMKQYGCMPREYKKQYQDSQIYYERRKATMFTLSDRCAELREEVVNRKSQMQHYFCQRIVYFALGGAQADRRNADPVEIYAAATANVLRRFQPYIVPGELITGFNFGDADLGDCVIPDIGEWWQDRMRENRIPEEDIQAYCALAPRWRSFHFMSGLNLIPEDTVQLTDAEAQAKYEWAAIGRCICHNHSVIGYEKVLKLGFAGLYDQVCAWEAKNGPHPLYNGTKEICLAAMEMGEKYAAEAKRLLDSGDPAYDAADLEFIIETCSNVPRNPARTFREAVQALWFAHIINTWEDVVNANSLGRLDQILYPYYKADLEQGRITREEAFELICCLWLKLYRDYDVQQSCVGGTNPDGTSAVNDLSYMMLDATECLDFVRCLSVRYSAKNTDKAFVKRALEVVGHVRKGVPFFFNDDVMIPALLAKGIAPEHAYDYTQLGCVETIIPGRANPHAVTGETNLLKAIEYVLNRGASLAHPELSPGVDTGDPAALTIYDKFYAAVLTQVDRILDLTCSQVKKYCDACVSPKPYKSLLTEGCLESRRDINEKGALYDYYQIMLGGIPNLADSLLVIKKFVYEDKKYTLAQLKDILAANFPEEAVRLDFVRGSAKFGNDLDEVDNIAIDLINHSCDELEKLSVQYERDFHAQPFTFLWMIDHGRHSAASPDGRRAGEPIAYSVSPMQGRDFAGLTAVLNSIAKLPTLRTPGTTSAIVEVDPKLFTDKNIGVLADILLAASKKGLSNVQFNTIDAETLIDAKNHPEKYNNLAVRVSGFSQKFNLLSPELQDHIIGRTKHACL